MSIRQRIANFINPTQKNSWEDNLAREFFRYGNRQPMLQDWSQVWMTDRDKYTGYLYGAIERKANKVAWLATYNLRTRANERTFKEAKDKGEAVEHPYLKLINDSIDFDNFAFWHDIQTFLGLKGVYYLMAVRARNSRTTGEVKSFKLLNPYDITRVRNLNDSSEVIAYTEQRDGMYRDIEPHMIIEFRPLNPFSRDDPFAMADAAKDAQFKLRQSDNQVRSTLSRNSKFPGAVMVGDEDITVSEENLQNFKARILGQARDKQGEPLFVSGKGTLGWEDMQVDLKKSLPAEVNETSLNALIAATGVSKTKFGIEQSGVTRDTAEVQDDQFVADHAMPALQLIIANLNIDYQRNYPDEYKKYGYELYIDSPLGVDREAEKLDVELRGEQQKLAISLSNQGYDYELAVKYATGTIDLVDLGKPKTPPAPKTREDGKPDDEEEEEDPAAANSHAHNALSEQAEAEIGNQTATLQAAVVGIENKLAGTVLDKVTGNAFEREENIIDKADRDAFERELQLALQTFYTVILPLWAQQVMQERVQEFSLPGVFSLDQTVKKYINGTAKKASASHIDTIVSDLLETIQVTYERLVEEEVAKLKGGPEIPGLPDKGDKELYELARKKALEGNGTQQIIAAIRKEYQEISTKRAKVIAQNESARAFNRSQYEADRQFIAQNGLEGKAYKKWQTRSGNPCPFCRAKESEPPIPFDQAFAELGDVLTTTYEKEDGTTSVRKLPINFEEAQAGNLHVNCQCRYVLIITS